MNVEFKIYLLGNWPPYIGRSHTKWMSSSSWPDRVFRAYLGLPRYLGFPSTATLSSVCACTPPPGWPKPYIRNTVIHVQRMSTGWCVTCQITDIPTVVKWMKGRPYRPNPPISSCSATPRNHWSWAPNMVIEGSRGSPYSSNRLMRNGGIDCMRMAI